MSGFEAPKKGKGCGNDKDKNPPPTHHRGSDDEFSAADVNLPEHDEGFNESSDALTARQAMLTAMADRIVEDLLETCTISEAIEIIRLVQLRLLEDYNLELQDSDQELQDSDQELQDSDQELQDSDQELQDSDQELPDSDQELQDSDPELLSLLEE